MRNNLDYLFTSESVTEGHPDKLCDKISDAILDELLAQDAYSRVACETFVTTGMVLVAGEISTNGYIDIPRVVRQVIKDVGYTSNSEGFNGHSCAILTSIDEQSPDIALGVDHPISTRNKVDKIGAGDQGMMFGYACNETPEFMPLAISLAHKLTKKLTSVRKSGKLKYLCPDGKAQVTIKYENGAPALIDSIVLSAQHQDGVRAEQIRQDILEEVIQPVIGKERLMNTKLLINPTGRFVIGGPHGDSGLTGRKIIVDTYGGYGRHGGGAFSGKNPTKVDRSGAYAARYIAKNIVAAELAERCEVQLAYAIGVAEPMSININTFNTGKISERDILEVVRSEFPLTPFDIIEAFDLRKPIYQALSSYGHMGREELCVAWENIDKIKALQSIL